jgi:hypothetical protein
MKNTTRKLSALALLAAGLLLALAGCESDSTAPKDELPAISQEAAAEQAGYFAYALTQAYDIYQDALGGKEVDIHSFSRGDASGSFTMDFRSGGPGGTPASSGAADYVHIYTDTGQDVRITRSGQDLPLAVATFDVDVYPYDSTPPESGTLNGGGNLVSGAYTSTFTVTDLVQDTSTYPPSGALGYSAGDHDVRVVFTGSRMAQLYIGPEGSAMLYLVDLDTGDLIAP